MQNKLAEAKHTLKLANDYMDNLAVTADQLAHTKVTNDQVVNILNELFPVDDSDSDRKKRNVSETKEQFMVCMLAPDIAKFQNTAWGVINAASDFMSHSQPKRASDTFKERRFNQILDGDIILDSVFEKLLKERVALRA